MEYILSQISGAIALVLVCISYFCKKKSGFLILQIFADLFYAGSYLLINIYVAGIITIISAIRCIVFYICEKKNFKYTIWTLPVFILGYSACCIIFWQGLGDLVPLITCTLFTIGYVLKNVQAIRFMSLAPNLMLVIYNIFCTTYTNALLDSIELIVVVVAIIIHIKHTHKEKL